MSGIVGLYYYSNITGDYLRCRSSMSGKTIQYNINIFNYNKKLSYAICWLQQENYNTNIKQLNISWLNKVKNEVIQTRINIVINNLILDGIKLENKDKIIKDLYIQYNLLKFE